MVAGDSSTIRYVQADIGSDCFRSLPMIFPPLNLPYSKIDTLNGQSQLSKRRTVTDRFIGENKTGQNKIKKVMP